MEDDKYKVFNGRDLDKKFDRVVNMTIEQFKNGVLDGSLAYEIILDEMVPIYDRDHKLPGANAKELADADQAILTEGIAALRAVWGPDAIIHSFTSTGIKRSFDRDGYNGPFVSHRHIVRGVGKFESGAELKRSGRVPAMFDQSIYVSKGGQKLMRIWGGSKAGEDRPMKYYLHGLPKTLEEANNENPGIANINFMFSLAQYVAREPLIVVPGTESVVSLTEGKTGRIVALGGNGEPLGEDVNITSVKQIRDLCVIAGKFQEVNRDHAAYFPLIFEICNVGMDNDLNMTEMRALAHEVAAVCPNNDPRDVDKLFNKTMTRRKDQTRKHLGCLRGEARRKNEGAYLLWYESVKVLKVDRDKPKEYHNRNKDRAEGTIFVQGP